MTAAVSLSQAALLAAVNVQGIYESVAPTDILRELQADWIEGFVPLTQAAATDAVVNSWAVPSTFVMINLPELKADEDQADANYLGRNLYQVCTAMQFAETNGDITAGQATALLALYNAIWA